MRVPTGTAIAGVFGIVPAIIAFTTWMAKEHFAATIAAKRVAILGGPQVGKTSLLRILESPATDNALAATADPVGGDFEMDIAGKTVTFNVPRDLGSEDGLALQSWKHAFETAGHIWYLFRADRIAAGDSKEISLVRKHLESLAAWMDDGHQRKVVLIGTWADASDEWRSRQKAFERRIETADPIKIARVKLDHAGLIVGSLGSVNDAKALARSLRKQYRYSDRPTSERRRGMWG